MTVHVPKPAPGPGIVAPAKPVPKPGPYTPNKPAAPKPTPAPGPRPVAPPTTRSYLDAFADEDADRIAAAPGTPAEMLALLSEHRDFDVLERLAANPSTSPDLLLALWKSSEEAVADVLAEQADGTLASTDATDLIRQERALRRTLANHPNADASLMVLAAQDTYLDPLAVAARSRLTPTDALLGLVRKELDRLDSIKGRLRDGAVARERNLILLDRVLEVIHAAVANLRFRGVDQFHERDISGVHGTVDELVELAQDPDTPVEVVIALFHMPVGPVSAAAASRADVPVQVATHWVFVNDNPTVHEALAGNRAVSEDGLARILHCSTQRHYDAYENHDADGIQEAGTVEVALRELIASHPNAKARLYRALAKDPHLFLRHLAAGSPHTPADQLQELINREQGRMNTRGQGTVRVGAQVITRRDVVHEAQRNLRNRGVLID